jgi:hypothetical protein
MLDFQAGGISLIFLALMEVLVVGWAYGNYVFSLSRVVVVRIIEYK